MNQPAQQVSIVDNLLTLEGPFTKNNAYALKFENECVFAKQQLLKSDFTRKTAENNQNSLKAAILNVAAIGISLNPATAHAYLVPRGGAICLDISYRGLVKLATDSGAIAWAKAILVYEGDTFKWRGPAEQPLHEADVFNAARIDAANPLNNLKGGYCLAKLASGEYMVDVMTAAEILEVRDSSKAKDGPWQGRWAGEMAKKTLVKRASKSWPQSGGRERLDRAIEIVNEHEGYADEPTVARLSDFMRPTAEQTAKYLELADGDSVAFYLWYRSQDERLRASLPGCEFEKGKKQATMKYFNDQLENGRAKLEGWGIDLLSLCESEDDAGVSEFLCDLAQPVRDALIDTLPPAYQRFARGCI
jgi:phage RecT family recombinase